MNQRIRRLTLFLLALYVVLFAQLNVLQVVRKDSLDADSRNNRQTVRDYNEPRGEIVTIDGVVIARSLPNDPGSEFALRREYPTGELFSSVTGYYTFSFGASQLERTMNDVLAGRTTEQQVKGLAALFTGADTTGSVEVTLDSRIQAAARDALGDREGSVVVLDVATGAVEAMWSRPTFDPNVFAVQNDDLLRDIFAFGNATPGKPLLANAYQERYMPGSTFKVITMAAALDAGVVTTESTFADEAEFLPPQTIDPIENYGGSTCGGDLAEVFRRSCNTAFAHIALDLGPEAMVAATERFGVGTEIPFDLPRPATARFGSVEYFEQNLPLLAIGGFGQGETQLSPLHMAMVAASVANGGRMMRPHVVAATYDHDGRLLDRTVPGVWQTPMSEPTAELITSLMIGVVNEGTARCCMALAGGIQAAAKTGTAQLNGPGEPERSHAWIIGFAPAEQPKYAIAVMLKGTDAEISAGTGGTLAGPVAKKVLDVALSL